MKAKNKYEKCRYTCDVQNNGLKLFLHEESTRGLNCYSHCSNQRLEFGIARSRSITVHVILNLATFSHTPLTIATILSAFLKRIDGEQAFSPAVKV